MRRPHSLKSAHWVMWSSPVLLLVLVFTLTASSSSTPPRHLATHATSSTTTVPTATSTSTTLAPVAAKPSHPATTTTVPTTKVTTPRSRPAFAATTITTYPPPTNVNRASNSSSGTDSSVKSNANGSAENASNDVVSGQLSPELAVADVPLRGPGTWAVASSAPLSVTLTCAGTTITVQTQFEIAAHTSCQITITAPSSNQNVTWELVPNS
jgi:hypothetical protein